MATDDSDPSQSTELRVQLNCRIHSLTFQRVREGGLAECDELLNQIHHKANNSNETACLRTVRRNPQGRVGGKCITLDSDPSQNQQLEYFTSMSKESSDPNNSKHKSNFKRPCLTPQRHTQERVGGMRITFDSNP